MTFTQLAARHKNFLMEWLLVLGLKESLVECATLCVKSEVMLRCKYITELYVEVKKQKIAYFHDL